MSNSAQQSVLETHQLHRTLGDVADRVHVLRGITLSLERGKTYAVVGPSGCGKSTLLYLLGLLDPFLFGFPGNGKTSIAELRRALKA